MGSTACLRLRLIAVLAVAVLLFAACTGQGVNDALARSTAPLLVPQGAWTNEFRFTAPPGGTDLYQFRWNFKPGRTDLVTGWQIASTTNYDETVISQGPGQSVVDQALRAARGEDCEIADTALEVQLCTYPSEFSRGGVTAYLIRLEQNQILVVDYLNIDGDPMTYNPDSLEALYLAADFTAVAIDGDLGDYLVTIY